MPRAARETALAYMAAWNAHDARACAECFAEDGVREGRIMASATRPGHRFPRFVGRRAAGGVGVDAHQRTVTQAVSAEYGCQPLEAGSRYSIGVDGMCHLLSGLRGVLPRPGGTRLPSSIQRCRRLEVRPARARLRALLVVRSRGRAPARPGRSGVDPRRNAAPREGRRAQRLIPPIHATLGGRHRPLARRRGVAVSDGIWADEHGNPLVQKV